MTIRNTRPNPYVGPRAFRAGEQLYGRDREVHELLNHLIAERIVLLHSPSGAGKTSLIRAGLLPHLQEEGFHILPVIRVNQLPPDGLQANRYLYSIMLSLEEELAPDDQARAEDLAGMDLLGYLERRQKSAAGSGSDGGSESEVLVFDQFEEILTIDPTDTAGKAAFFAQVGLALRDRSRWALFAMREDYMAALNPYLRPVPTRLRSTYRLDLLSAAAARQAIQKPASSRGVAFSDKAASKLVDDLRSEHIQLLDASLEERRGPHVEPVHLQVVCFRLWQNLSPDDMEISIEDIEDVGDVNQSLGDYYAEQVAELAGQLDISERSIRDWFENQLITKHGIRSQVIMEPGSSGGLPNDAIRQLQDAYLVRAEKRRGVTWFELAHDRLVRPVREDNAIWFRTNLSLLQRQAALWEDQGRPEGLLLRDQELLDAEKWSASHQDELSEIDVEFLKACLQAQETQERIRAEQVLRLETAQKLAESEKQRAEEQVSAAKQLRRRLIVATTALLLALGLAIVAGILWNSASRTSAENASLAATNAEIAAVAETASSRAAEQQATAEYNAEVAGENQIEAERQAAEAQRQARIALSGQLAAQSRAALERSPVRGLLLAVESVQVPLAAAESEPAAARQALYDGLANAGGIALQGHAGELWTLAFSPDGRWLATGGEDRRVILWDITSSDPAAAPLVLQTGGDARVGHAAEVTSLVFSPAARWLVSGSRDMSAILWDLKARDPAASGLKLQGHQNIIDVVAASPDGRWLVTGDRSGAAFLWDLMAPEIAESARALQGHESEITALAFSPDGRWLATGSTDTTILLWDLGGGELAIENPWVLDHTAPILALAFSPDGRWLAGGGRDTSVWVWDISEGQLAEDPFILPGHEEEIRALVFSPQGTHLASAGVDATIRLWPINAEGPSENATILRGHSRGVVSLAFSPEGRWLASGSTDSTARLWDLSRRDPAATSLVLRGHEGTIRSLAFSPDGRWLGTGGNDDLARLWDLRGPTIAASPLMLPGHQRNVRSLAFTPDGRWLATSADDGQIRLWDLASPDPLLNFTRLEGHSDDIRAMAISPDGRWLASGGGDRNVLLWDLSSAGGAAPVVLGRHGGKIWAVTFSPDGRWLATGSRDQTVRFWDMRAPAPGMQPIVLEGFEGEVFAAAFSPDGRWLAGAGEDGVVRLWEITAQGPALDALELRGHEGTVQSLAFSPDGRWLATAGADQRVRLWDLTSPLSNLELIELEGHSDAILTLAFSPDGRWLASGSQDRATRLWDLKGPGFPEEIRSHLLRRHLGGILSLAFSPDGRWLATSSEDASIRLWDLGAVEPGANPVLMTISPSLLRGIADVWVVAISPDGRWLASGSRDGVVRLWLLPLPELVGRICAMTGRNLSMDEWLEFRPGVSYAKTCPQWGD